MSDFSITEHFSLYFELVVANTPKLKQEVFSIRYQVYCQELNYEPVSNFPDGLERDEYDHRSIHYLLKHRPSGVYAGCVRVVLPEEENPEAIFPLEKACPGYFNLMQRPRSQFCEISRLAVISKFRRRKGESQTPEGIVFFRTDKPNNQFNRRSFPLIALSLYWACIGTGPILNLDVLALMEPRLARHFRYYGIISQRIGDLVEHRGKRGFYLIQPTKFLDNLQADMRELFDLIAAERESQCGKNNKHNNNYIKCLQFN